jgi:hypothetical protein
VGCLGGGTAVDFHAVEEDAFAVACNGGVEGEVGRDGEFVRLIFDHEGPPAHGVALDRAGLGRDASAAGEAEIVLQVLFFGTGSGEVFGA